MDALAREWLKHGKPAMKSSRAWRRRLLPLFCLIALPAVRAADTAAEANCQLRLAGQALRLGQEHEAVSRLAKSVRLQPENNPATTALLFLLTFRDHPLPLFTSGWADSWLPGDWLAYRPEFSHDGKLLYWGGATFDVRDDGLVPRDNKSAPGFSGFDDPVDLAGRLAKVAERGHFIGLAMPDFATDTKDHALSSADRSVAMILPEDWLGDGSFPRYQRYSARFPNTLAFAFPPDRSDRLATLELCGDVPPYHAGRLRLWDIRPSAPQAPPNVDEAPDAPYLPESLRYSASIERVFKTPSGRRRCLLNHGGDGTSIADPDDHWRILWTSPKLADPRNRAGYRLMLADDSALLWWEGSRFRSDEASTYDRVLVDVENGKAIETFPADEHPFRAIIHGPWLMLDRGGLGGVLYDARKRKVVMRSGIDGEGRPEWRPAGLVDPDHRYWLLRRPGDSALLDLETLEIAGRVPLAADGSHAPDDFAAYHPASGRLALGNHWGDTWLFAPAENRLIHEFPRRHAYHKDVSCHAWFHPDGGRLYLSIGNTESDENSDLHAWDTMAGRFIAAKGEANLRFRASGEGEGTFLRFSPCGSWLLGENHRGAPILFDSATGGSLFHAVGTRGTGLDAEILQVVLRMAPTQAPAWLADLAEWTSGVRITDDDVPTDTGRAYDLDWLKSQRTALLAAPRDDFTRWGLWFLGDRDNRESWPAAQVAEP